jgi:hypothetical protein
VTLECEPLDAAGKAAVQRSFENAVSHDAEDAGYELPDPLPIDQWVKKHGTGGGVKWIWEGYLPRISLSILIGLEKLGKTTLLLHLLQAICCQKDDFLGRTLDGGKVLIVTQENADIWFERFKEYELDPSLIFVQEGPDGQPRPFYGHAKPHEWRRFAEAVAKKVEANDFRLVILDVISDWWPVEQENSASEVANAVAPWAWLAETTRCCVLAIHHSPKSGKGGRGSNAFPGRADSILTLTGNKKTNTRTLEVEGRYRHPKPQKIRLTSAGYVVEGTSEAGVSDKAESRKSHCRTFISDVLPKMPSAGQGWTVNEVAAAWPGDPKKRPNDGTIRDLLAIAVEDRKLIKDGKGGQRDPYRYRRTSPREGS